MLVEFMELSKKDNSTLGPIFVNPRHVVSIRRVPIDPELAITASIIRDVRGELTHVLGGPSKIQSELNAGSR